MSVIYLSHEFRADSEFRNRFAGESAQLVRIRDARVARLRQYVECGEGTAVVADQVAGTPLRALLREEGAVRTEAALVLFKEVLRGLAACHEAGVVYGDLKPESVILTRAGRVRLVDAGLFTCAGRQLLARSTPFYLAPEQWGGGQATSPGDVYAATVIFFECLAGGPPFHADGTAALSALHEQEAPPVDAVPVVVRQLVRNGLAKDPASRPGVRRFLTHIEEAATDGLGPGWERRGRRELIRLKAGASSPSGRLAAAGWRRYRGWDQVQPVRLAGVLGGALVLAVGLSSPQVPSVLRMPTGPGSASGSEGSSPVLAFPAPPAGTGGSGKGGGTPLTDQARNPRSAAMLGPADPPLVGGAPDGEESTSIPSAYQGDPGSTFGRRQRSAADPAETQLDQPSQSPSAPTTNPAPTSTAPVPADGPSTQGEPMMYEPAPCEPSGSVESTPEPTGQPRSAPDEESSDQGQSSDRGELSRQGEPSHQGGSSDQGEPSDQAVDESSTAHG